MNSQRESAKRSFLLAEVAKILVFSNNRKISDCPANTFFCANETLSLFRYGGAGPHFFRLNMQSLQKPSPICKMGFPKTAN